MQTVQKPQKNKGKNKRPQTGSSFWGKLSTLILLLMTVTVLYSVISKSVTRPEKVALSQVAEGIAGGLVQSIVVAGDDLTITFFEKTSQGEAVIKIAKKEREASLTETLSNYGVPSEALAKVLVTIDKERGTGAVLLSVLPIVLPLLLIVFFIWMLTRSMKGQGMQAMNFGQSKANMIGPNDTRNRVTFQDVAGAREAKQELEEIVDFLKEPKKYLDIGAQIPKGVLLEGDPGTGKTLLARAVAGEARVPYFYLSGSDFVEMFVGVGASRVRDLFKMAKRVAPAIIFIDEIDAVGRKRGSGHGGGNDEREQTLNQILTEMDGFEQNQKVIVLAATNRADVLDTALLRPGRFDRRVHVELPDRKDRRDILAIHTAKKVVASDINLDLIAERTHGFSGADLHSLVNESAIRAARDGRTQVTQMDLIVSIEKVLIGPERHNKPVSQKERSLTAYHEAGHALVASVLPHADPVHKVTIVPRGRAGGYVLHLPIEDKKTSSRNEFVDDLAVTLAGYATEQLLYGEVTTGPSSDLATATRLARSMVTRWGMSEAIGPIALESRDGDVLFGGGHSGGYSEAMSKRIDEEVSLLITNALATATRVITEKRDALDAIARTLLEVETLEQAEFATLMLSLGIAPKTRTQEGISLSPEPVA